MALQDDDAFTAVHDLAVCLLIPVFHGSAGGSIGALGVDQHDIVQGIPVEPAHGGEVVAVAVTFKQFHDAFFDTGGDLFDAILIRLLFGQVFALLSLI